jgi:hypothetical protein
MGVAKEALRQQDWRAVREKNKHFVCISGSNLSNTF